MTWRKDWDTVLEWNLPYAKWFVGGTLNVSDNCLDRHVQAGRGDKVAYHWEGEPGDARTFTYAELLDEVCRFANVLKDLGVAKGDRVCLYMPMIPELPIAMLACARIGAPHSVVFGGFCVQRARRPHQRRRGQGPHHRRRRLPPRRAVATLKPAADVAVADTSTIEHVVVVNRCDTAPDMVEGRDLWWHELMADASADCPAEEMDSEDLLYLLYTSGTTGKPKGIMHTTGGYLTQVAFTHKYVFDIHPDTDVYWCAADIGWVTGHSYIVYGPLTNGVTSVMYEGAPNHPDNDRLWDMIERYGVTKFYTAPTAIRTFMKWGRQEPDGHDLSHPRGPRHRRRAHQPRGLDLVPRGHRPRALPHRRHLVADRDRRHHDQPPARRHHHPPGLRHPPAARHLRRARRRRGQPRRRGRRLPHHHRAVAVDAPRHLGRPRALRATPTGRASTTGTSPATAPRSTPTATSGSSAASTTS